MSALTTVRALIHDTETVKRFTDNDINSLMDTAIGDLNAWADTTWTVADIDADPSSVPITHTQIFYLLCKLYIIDAELANVDKGTKMVTQDVQLDASTSMGRLNRTRMLLLQDLDKKLVWWLGIKSGAVAQHVGDSWGGA